MVKIVREIKRGEFSSLGKNNAQKKHSVNIIPNCDRSSF